MPKLFAMFLAAMLMFAAAVQAEEADKAAKKAEKKEQKDPTAQFFQAPKGIELSEDQKKQLDKIREEYKGKVEEAVKARSDIYTPEQKQAQADARKAAAAAGKKDKELKAEIEAAVKLTDEQKTRLAEADKKLSEVRKTVQQKIMGILTEEQKAKFREQKKSRKDPAAKTS